MKKLFVIVLVTVLTSCGGSISNEQAAQIIGNPIKVGNLNLLVTQNDFPKKMNWDDAKKACESLGDGWRLPTKDELQYLYQNKISIGIISDNVYWSSTEINNDFAFTQSFYLDDYETASPFSPGGGTQKNLEYYVRAVRALGQSAAKLTKQNIIGKPSKFGIIEITQYDFPDDTGYPYRMNWEDAKKACESLGDGWRLPTKDELTILYQNENDRYKEQYKIGGFAPHTYWSSSESEDSLAWCKDFRQGNDGYMDKGSGFLVRAIRADYKKFIGEPIRVGNLNFLVAQNDFPIQMNWEDAKKACEALGDGWRLPDRSELNYIYQNKVAIGGFTNFKYWSSTEDDLTYAWVQHLDDGYQVYDKKDNTNYVRAIRAF